MSPVELRDGFRRPLRLVAGLAVRVDAGVPTRVAAVLFDAADGSVRETHCATAPAMPAAASASAWPDAAGALLAALALLSGQPELVLAGAPGFAHPTRQGPAGAFGLASGLPTIGVSEDAGDASAAPLHQVRGAYTPLRDGRLQVGWLVRTREGDAPLAVSPGHRVAMASAADLVMGLVGGHRWPEPLHLARRALGAGGD